MVNFEARVNVKFLTKLNCKLVDIIEALQQVYGDSAPCRAVMYDWIKCFEEDNPQGRCCTLKNQENTKLVQSLINEIAMAVGISHGSAFFILKRANFQHIGSKSIAGKSLTSKG